MTVLPALSPRGGPGGGRSKQKSDPSVGAQSYSNPADTFGSSEKQNPIKAFTPHDVAEWLYGQNTKDDLTHTFLVHGIDGPALLGLKREQLLEWKVKPVDATTIINAIRDLKKIADGQIGYNPSAEIEAAVMAAPSAPSAPRGGKPTPRGKKAAAPPAPSETVAPAEQTEGDGGEGSPTAGAPSPEGEWALTSVTAGPASTRRAPRPDGEAAKMSVSAASPSYLRKVMTELHTSERVPLWKEEMVERVKRQALQKQQQKTVHELSPSAPSSARGHGRHRTGDMAVTDFKSTARTEASADEDLDATSGGGRSSKVRNIERKIFWYQDAIHEQELQQQLLDQKIRALSSEVATALDNRTLKYPELKGVGVAQLEKELQKRQLREKSRLSRALQVSEERVADAERLNSATVANINKMRRARADFLHQVARLEERVKVMVNDMKHFSSQAHASLDEKEKVEARLKRQQFDFRNEVAHFEHMFEGLQEELTRLDDRIQAGHQAEEDYNQQQRQLAYQQVKEQRDDDQKREMRLGYLQNHVRGQEMDFQRLHRIMGVKFTPEKPDSVQEIVKASLSHEQRNASLLHYVGVQNATAEQLMVEVRDLEKEEAFLIVDLKEGTEKAAIDKAQGDRSAIAAQGTLDGIAKREDDLAKLCPIVEKLTSLSGAAAAAETEQGGVLQLKGCRPDTLTDFLRLIDVSIKELRMRALSLPTATGNEWLRDFLAYKEIVSHPTVTELRKEIEAHAQKVKEQKEAKGAAGGDDSGGGGGFESTAAE